MNRKDKISFVCLLIAIAVVATMFIWALVITPQGKAQLNEMDYQEFEIRLGE